VIDSSFRKIYFRQAPDVPHFGAGGPSFFDSRVGTTTAQTLSAIAYSRISSDGVSQLFALIRAAAVCCEGCYFCTAEGA
jgi:hypothetical protein